MINVYCDESCHLEYDRESIMLLGGLSCPQDKVKIVSNEIRNLKEKHNLSRAFEIKWTKVSPGKVGFYLELLNYFWENQHLCFRAVVANKTGLDNEGFNQTYDDWYYKMYYLLLSKMIDPLQQYNVYVDIKDTNGGPKIRVLKTILDNFLYKFREDCLNNIQIIKSNESELLQLNDFLLGIIGYKNRFLKDPTMQKEYSDAKVQLCEKLIELSGRTLIYKTPLAESKLNLFFWTPVKERRNGDL